MSGAMINVFVSEPSTIDIKNPTHVEVHNVQLISVPKNFDFLVMKARVLSKMDPQTKIDVKPYAIKIQSNNVAIIYIVLNNISKNSNNNKLFTI